MPDLICPSCSEVAPQGAIYCDNCGYDLRTFDPVGQSEAPKIPLDTSEPLFVVRCQNCGYENLADSIYCENCGSKLTSQQEVLKSEDAGEKNDLSAGVQASNVEVPVIDEKQPLPIIESELVNNQALQGSLFVVNANQSIPIPEFSHPIIIGRDDPASGIFPDINLEPFGAIEAGVGRRHVQLSSSDGLTYVEDLESVNGTYLNREKLEPKTTYQIRSGDELRLGKLVIRISF